jgi:hypothetical protein
MKLQSQTKSKKHTQTKPQHTEMKIRSDENNQSFVFACATEEEEDDDARRTKHLFFWGLLRRNKTP